MVAAHRRHSLAVTTPKEGSGRNRFPRVVSLVAVTFPRPAVDIQRPPARFDEVVDWFELVSYNLVLLEDYRLEDVRRAVDRVALALEAHNHAAGSLIQDATRGPAELRERARILTADHEWFQTSIEQLRWFLAVVEREDHGGHRQALGQYGRVLCESVRRHRTDEEEFVRLSTIHPAGTSVVPPPSNAN
jgi:hypothetical protein